MRIIDLLNKIANDEKVPNKFIYDDLIFTKHDDCGCFYYKDNDGDNFLDSICNDLSNLNDNIEIMQEKEEDNFTGIKWFDNGEMILSVDSSEKMHPEHIEDKEIKPIKQATIDSVSYKDNYSVANSVKFLMIKMNEMIEVLEEMRKDNEKPNYSMDDQVDY